MLWLEIKYASLISSHVKRYKRLSGNVWNFRCPYCSDSATSKTKARGYIYQKKDILKYHCHNCSLNIFFSELLRFLDESLYLEMKKELISFKNDKNKELEFIKESIPKINIDSCLKSLKRISQLPNDHYCKQYVISRMIPNKRHHDLYYCERFKEWTNSIIPEKFDLSKKDEPRLIIPLFNKKKKLVGYQGRSFIADDKLKYITIMLDSDETRLYGLDRLNTNRRYYAVEGPIDAMFLPNAIASCGSDITSEMEKAKLFRDNAVIIYDNEPRNKDTIKKIRRAIRKGYRVVIWPDNLNDKDINLMYQNNLPVMEIINANIYRELEAEARLVQWKKI